MPMLSNKYCSERILIVFKSCQAKKKVVKIFFYHLPSRISRMFMRIYIFCFKKTHTYKQKISSFKFIGTNLRFFPSNNKRRLFVFQKRKVLLEQLFKCKLCLKNSIKLIFFFCGRPGEHFFRHLHFRKQEYYFFWPH